jgi:NADH-quinone oxidoreductase subunit N
MTQFLLINIIPVLPEMVMAACAMVLLIIGVFKGAESSELISRLSMIIILITGVLLLKVSPVATVAMGGFFISNGFIVIVKLLILAGGLLVLPLAQAALPVAGTKFFEYPVLLLFALLGMMLMVSAGNFLSLYMGLELQSLCLYVLAACNRDNEKSSEAGIKYFILGALTSGILLFGISLIYGFSGSTSFTALSELFRQGITPANVPVGIMVGLILVIIGFCFKISAVPFHMWTPDVYEGAPTPVTAFFATAPKVAACAILVRALMEPFGDWIQQWQQIIVVLSAASMIVGAIGALRQKNIKRLMAYSSIGHVGFILMALASANSAGIEAVLIYLAIYITMSAGVFAIIIMMRRQGEPAEMLSDLSGFARSHPLAAIAMTIFMLSMTGIPPLAGFFGKFYVLLAAIDAKLYALAVIGVVSSVISAYYYINIIRLMYFEELGEPLEALNTRGIKVISVLTALFNLLYFVYPTQLVGLAESAAHVFFL